MYSVMQPLQFSNYALVTYLLMVTRVLIISVGGDLVLQAYDQHLNMILGDVEEVVTTVEIDDETYEEIVRVCCNLKILLLNFKLQQYLLQRSYHVKLEIVSVFFNTCCVSDCWKLMKVRAFQHCLGKQILFAEPFHM